MVMINIKMSYLDYSFSKRMKNFNDKVKSDILMNFRLAYITDGEVNWCEGLGTVLANDEIINGLSERGGYPVTKEKLNIGV